MGEWTFYSDGMLCCWRHCENRWSSGAQEQYFRRLGPRPSGPWALVGSRQLRASRISDSEILILMRIAWGGETRYWRESEGCSNGLNSSAFSVLVTAEVESYNELEGGYHVWREIGCMSRFCLSYSLSKWCNEMVFKFSFSHESLHGALTVLKQVWSCWRLSTCVCLA